jgi:hypothetical protein
MNHALGHLSSLSATLLWRLDRQKPECPVLGNLSPNKNKLPGVLELLVGCLAISPHAKAWAKIWGKRTSTRPTVGPGANGRPSLCKNMKQVPRTALSLASHAGLIWLRLSSCHYHVCTGVFITSSAYTSHSLHACVSSPLSLISRPVPIPPPSKCLLLIGTPFVILPYGLVEYLAKQLYSYLAEARRPLSWDRKAPISHQPSSLVPQAA